MAQVKTLPSINVQLVVDNNDNDYDNNCDDDDADA